MTDDEKNKIVDIIHGCAELLNRQLSGPALALYVKVIEDLPYDKLSFAFSECVRNKRFFPSPAEVREMVLGPPESLEDNALIEATKVLQAVRRYGSRRSVVFDDPVTMAVIRQHFNGWEALGELPESENKWWIKEFTKAYVAFTRAGLKSYGLLYGATDRENSAKGYELTNTPPVLIGDPNKALEVWQSERQNDGALVAMRGKGQISRLLEKIGDKINDFREGGM
jgi:hypothetical protein